MNDERLKWRASSVKLTPENTLIIEADPDWENKKRWQGEMEFRLGYELVTKLHEQMQQRHDKQRMKEIAKAELMEFLADMKAEYLQKKKSIADQLGLALKEMPDVYWSQFDNENTKTVDVDCER